MEQSLDIAFKEELEVYDGLIIPDGMELTIEKEMENNLWWITYSTNKCRGKEGSCK